MLNHYLTIAFRNMRKYMNQTLISIAGLAMGFTCFALSALWIRYEMTYDTFHRDADRIYCTYASDMFSKVGSTRSAMPYPLAGYLKETFPEIEEAMAIIPTHPSIKIKIEEVEYPAHVVTVDSTVLSFFGVRIVEGSRDFLIPDSKKMAITREKARQFFGEEDPIGKKVKRWTDEYTICAVIAGLPRNSNYRFDILIPFHPMKEEQKWMVSMGENILLKLMPGVDAEVFGKKLNEHEMKQSNRTMKGLTLKRLTQVRYTDLNIDREVKFQHILIFALSGSLLILCTLFNYLTLFVSRFRMRQKEMALRMVCGASKRSLFTLLSVEFVLSLLIALLFGLFFIQLLHAPFQKLSEIELDLSEIFGETTLYIGGVIVGSLMVFQLILALFHRRTLQASIRQSNRNRFRKMSILVQLVISIGFTFCTVVILKQMYYLHHTDLGFAFKDRGAVSIGEQMDVLENKIREIPEIQETLLETIPLIPMSWRMGSRAETWDEKPEDAKPVSMESLIVSESYLSYYEFRLIAGEMIRNSDPETDVLINEAAQKAFGWKDAVGKKFNDNTVKGVVKDVYCFAPTVPAKPFFYKNKGEKAQLNTVLFRYETGKWNTCRRKIETIIKELYPNNSYVYPSNTEEEYDKFLKSENALLRLLSVVSFACILICVFGFFSLISLTCEERRKEIAVRKISGATVRDILNIFLKENFLLLLIGAAVAFAGGYYIMQRWLEQYMKQTALPLWIYVSIVSVMALVILLSVGWRVYRASVENPAEVIKSE